MKADRPRLRRPLPGQLAPAVFDLESASPADVIVEELGRLGWATTVVDITEAESKHDIMSAFADALAFPSWFGHNWDALDEALRDLSWLEAYAKGRAFLVIETSHRDAPAAAELAVLDDVLDAAVARWATTTSPLVVLIRQSSPRR